MWNQTAMFKNPYSCYRPAQWAGRSTVRQESVAILPVNISESTDAYHFSFYVPGFSREEIQIREENGVLHVQTKPAESSNQEEMLRSEFVKKEMVRSIKFPRDARRDSVEAKLEGGILRISIKKDENLNKTVNIL
jgi:HSP20 family protein